MAGSLLDSQKSIFIHAKCQLQQNRFENRIVPLLWQSCDFDRLSWVLPSFQIIDFQRTFEDGCRDLLRLWGLGYQPSR